MASSSGNKHAILVYNKKGGLIKWFKVWYDSEKSPIAKIEITFKKNGEKRKLVKEYTGYEHIINGKTHHKVALICCVEAVIKYWPKYNPQKHEMAISAGHAHIIVKKKKKERG